MYYAELLRQEADLQGSPLAKLYYYKILASIYLKRDFQDQAIDAARHQAEIAQKNGYVIQLFDAYDKIANTLVFQNKVVEAQDAFAVFENSVYDAIDQSGVMTERQIRLQKDRSESSQVVLTLFFLMIMGLLVSIIYTAVSHNRSLQTVSES